MKTENIFKSDLLDEAYHLLRHSSGLPIYVFPKKMSSAYALFAVNFGGMDIALDAKGRKPLPLGLAHFLEHKLFTNEDGTDSFERFSALGADANAYTSHTRTAYLFSATEHFYESLAELITFVTHPYFSDESVEKEQGIIGEEIDMCRDNPYDRCYYNMLKGLYHATSVKEDICGTRRSIATITPELLYRTHRTFYRPSNMALVICGDVDVERVAKMADELLPATFHDGGTPPPRYRAPEAKGVAHAIVREAGQVAKPIFSIGMKDTRIPADPRERIRRDAGMAILNEMIFSEAGALYTHLFESGMISPGLSVDYALTEDFAFNAVAGEADDPEAVLTEIVRYLKELAEKGLSQEDFERCRRVEYAEYIKGFDSTEEIANTLLTFVFEKAELFSYADIVKGIELPFVEGLLAECFDPASFTLSVIDPITFEEGENENA